MKITKKQAVIIGSVAAVSLTAAAICYLIFYFMRKTKFKISANGLALIKSFEGLRYTAYLCDGGVWTIGYGHTKGVKEGDTCTLTEANTWLLEDVATAEEAVNKEGLNINQNQFDALVSFVFNVGESAFKDSTLLKKIKEDPNDVSISDEFARWRYAQGKVLQGLVNRREKESNLYFA